MSYINCSQAGPSVQKRIRATSSSPEEEKEKRRREEEGEEGELLKEEKRRKGEAACKADTEVVVVANEDSNIGNESDSDADYDDLDDLVVPR